MSTGLWFEVEDGFELVLSADAPSGQNRQFVGGARFVPNVGSDQMWDITPGPYQHTFKTGEGHSTVRIGLRFVSTEKATAVVKAMILDRSGNPHTDSYGNNEFVFTLSGRKGEGLKRGTLILIRKFDQ